MHRTDTQKSQNWCTLLLSFQTTVLRIPIIRAFLRLYYFLGDTETNPYQPLHMNFIYSAKAGYNVSYIMKFWL